MNSILSEYLGLNVMQYPAAALPHIQEVFLDHPDLAITLFSHRIFQQIHSFGAHLTAPLEYIAHRFEDLRMSNRSSYIKAGRMTLYIITALFALIVAQPGIALRTIVTWLSSNPIAYSPAIAIPASEKESSDSVIVMTWNLGLGLGIMTANNQLPLSHTRVDAICEYIKRVNPHIISVQEAFDSFAAFKLVQWLNRCGYDCVGPLLADGIRLSSGLLVAVKRAKGCSNLIIKKIAAWRFNNLVMPDSLANKGLVGVKIKTSDNKTLYIFNTHLQASYPKVAYPEVRKKQVQAIVARINEWTENSKKNIILCGDLNYAFSGLEDSDSAHQGQNNEYESNQMYFADVANLYDSNPNQHQGTFIKCVGGKLIRSSAIADYILTSKNLATERNEAISSLYSEVANGVNAAEENNDIPKTFPSDHHYVVYRIALDKIQGAALI